MLESPTEHVHRPRGISGSVLLSSTLALSLDTSAFPSHGSTVPATSRHKFFALSSSVQEHFEVSHNKIALDIQDVHASTKTISFLKFLFYRTKLVFTYDKINVYAKKIKKNRGIDTLSPNFELLIFSIQTQGINFLDRPFYQMRSFTKHVDLLLL